MTAAVPPSVPSPASRLQRHGVARNFLDPPLVTDLLAYTAANAHAFAPSRVGLHGVGAVDERLRISKVLRDLGPYAKRLYDRLAPLTASVCAQLAIAPFAFHHLQIELAAHGDGAFYGRHTDMQAPDPGTGARRRLSGVYYFHTQPKAFEGGALRIYGGGGVFNDVAPEHNSCVFFPPEVAHEVLPVRCPSGRFMDSRFAINFWFVGM